MRKHKAFWLHSVIIFVQCLILCSFCVSIVFFQPAHSAIGLLIGVIFFALLEYVVHRFVMHEFPWLLPIAYKGHVAHHENPHDPRYLYSSLLYDLSSYFIYIVLLASITRSVSLTSAIVLGTAICQLFYQWMHYISHQPINPYTPWVKMMKKWHLRHHFLDDHAWYGVSNPMLDMMLQTDKQKSKPGHVPTVKKRDLDS